MGAWGSELGGGAGVRLRAGSEGQGGGEGGGGVGCGGVGVVCVLLIWLDRFLPCVRMCLVICAALMIAR